eukprot:s810_g34.t1
MLGDPPIRDSETRQAIVEAATAAAAAAAVLAAAAAAAAAVLAAAAAAAAAAVAAAAAAAVLAAAAAAAVAAAAAAAAVAAAAVAAAAVAAAAAAAVLAAAASCSGWFAGHQALLGHKSEIRQSLPRDAALSDGSPSPRASPRLSMQSSPRASMLMGSRVTLSSCEAIGSQVSYVLKDPKMEPPPPPGRLDSRSSLSESRSELRRGRDQEQVREMREVILRGQLDVMVFNKRRQPEDRKLGLLQASRRIQILRADGSCEDSWDIDHLQCISFGIAASILPEPPPADKTLSFRFHFQKYGTEARYLCAMFSDGATCRLAAAAFSQLCGVPVTTSEHFVQN